MGKKGGRLHIERDREQFQCQRGRVARPSFNAADIGPVQAAFERQRLLRQPARLADFLQILADETPYIHDGSEAVPTNINLQTISNIR